MAPQDPERAAAALLEVLERRELRDEVTAAGRVTAAGFALDRTIPQLEALYLARTADLLDGSPFPRGD